MFFSFPPQRLAPCSTDTSPLPGSKMIRHPDIFRKEHIRHLIDRLIKYHGRFSTKRRHQEDKKNRKAYNLAKCAARIPQKIRVVMFIAERCSVPCLIYPLWLFILFFAYCDGTLILRTITIADASFPNTYRSGAGLLYCGCGDLA